MNNKFLSISLIFISILISGFFITHAFTTPTANPPYTGGVINYLDGKIGIGTAEPSTILDVNGTITISSSIPTLTLGSNPNTYAYFQKYTDGNLYIYNKEIGKNLYLGTENSTDLTIDYSGKVGIGTTDPGSYKLKVQGDANITGTLTAGGFTGPVSGTLSAANVSAGSFGANTGGGNY
ncbi:hypothetical protein JW698_02415, partial [Candidatus Wolfebacteria bacterium]|nr:hypothetical protein [Candidatus Wolfebacteria bacterium]